MSELSRFFGFSRFHRLPSVPCEQCDWYRRVGGAGDICPLHEWMCHLAQNIIIAAALARAHRDGIQAGYLRSAL